MGLVCSHNAWHGSYHTFMWWRKKLAEVAGLPPLELMEGFYRPLDSKGYGSPTLYHGKDTNMPSFGSNSRPYMAHLDDRLPISWNCLKPSPLYELLYHSACDGEIAADRCIPIANALAELIPLFHENEKEFWCKKTRLFIDGLRNAAKRGEAIVFH